MMMALESRHIKDVASPYYLVVVGAPCYAVSDTSVAMESAFAEHLRQLQRIWASRFDCLAIAAPVMSRDAYAQRLNQWEVLHAESDRIRFLPMHPVPDGRLRYLLKHMVPNFFRLRRAVRQAGIIHAGPSHVYHPFECLAILLGVAARKPTIFVVDIDERRSSWMNYRSGRWSVRSYLLARLIYDPLQSLQVWLAARLCTLVLLKGQKLCDDFGRNNPRVRNFIDSAFSPEHIIPPADLEKKISGLQDRQRPLEAAYFGRLTAYKGIDRSIEAIARVVGSHGPVLRFHIIGTGEEEESLRALADRLGIGSQVVFHGALPFGRQLFDRLYRCDLLLATPLCEDTPRNALDAMASGVPILAFDTYYYRDLQRSKAIELVPWLSVEAMAERLAHHALNKPSLEASIRNAVLFARENTQEIWLHRRFEWTLQAIGAARG